MSGSDPTRFRSVIDVFRRYHYDPDRILSAFADAMQVQDVVAEKRNINQLKSELENNRHALDTMLSSLGLAEFRAGRYWDRTNNLSEIMQKGSITEINTNNTKQYVIQPNKLGSKKMQSETGVKINSLPQLELVA